MAHTPSPKNPSNVDRKMIDAFLENQRQQAINDANEIELRREELGHNADYARELLNKQYDLLKNKEKESRSNILTYAGIGLLFVLIICVFIIYLLHIKKDGLVDTIMTWGGRIAALTVSFILGRLSALKSMKDKPGDATQVVDP